MENKTAGHTPGSVKKGWILIPCDGEAHEHPRIDNCGVCAPRWGEIEVHEASFRIGQRRTAALLSAAKDALEELQWELKENGGCDHSVGICWCEYIRKVENLADAIAKAEGR